jgi:malate/lactate dehydrogenase-like protein/GDP-mannose 4,6 dehydratase
MDQSTKTSQTAAEQARVPATQLVAFVARAFVAAGLPDADAQAVAALMVEADLRGSDTHGVIRLPLYVRRLRAGGIKARANIRTLSDRASVALIDGDNSMGHLVMRRAAALAIEKAKASGIGGREKAPAAIARKVAMAVISGRHEIEIWGDGEQTRSFTFIDDCLNGTKLLMASDFVDPLNIGSDQMVSVNELVDIVERIAKIRLKRTYKLDAPKGVRGRNSDNTLIREVFDWAPSISLEDGMEQTYRWIYDQAKARAEGRVFVAAYD